MALNIKAAATLFEASAKPSIAMRPICRASSGS